MLEGERGRERRVFNLRPIVVTSLLSLKPSRRKHPGPFYSQIGSRPASHHCGTAAHGTARRGRACCFLRNGGAGSGPRGACGAAPEERGSEHRRRRGQASCPRTDGPFLDQAFHERWKT